MISSLALIVVIVVDQLRTDEILRARHQFSKTGIVRFLEQGISYEDAHHSNFVNMTCPGHAEISTGAAPGLHGLMYNEEWDYKEHREKYCVEDRSEHWLEAPEDEAMPLVGSSAKRLMTTTVGDELKALHPESRVVSVALKERAAITMAGHIADGVYWFAPQAGIWTTSTAYTKDKQLPGWLRKYNRKIKSHIDSEYLSSNSGVADTAEIAVAAAREFGLGRHKSPDLLWLSFSTHDIVAHEMGDESEELTKTMIAEDKAVSRLMAELQKEVGKKKILYVFTGDHGSGAAVDKAKKLGLPVMRMSAKDLKSHLDQCLKKAGVSSSGEPIQFIYTTNIFLNDSIKDRVFARIKTKECATQEEPVLQAYTREEILSGNFPSVPWLRHLSEWYYPERGPDVVVQVKPYVAATSKDQVAHDTSYDYDSWVPLSFWWQGVKHRDIFKRVDMKSVAPTLARILETRPPSGANSEFLAEVLESVQ